MTVDLIIHGVPKGQDLWGKDDDNHYLSTFYTPKDSKEYLLVEIRKINGKPYTYYHYLKYNNVVASDGRRGSYLGITLRMDAYYKDILNIYHILEVVYNRYLTDVAFSLTEGEGITYKVSKFELIDEELKEIHSKVINMISLSAKSKDFENITDSFFHNDNEVRKIYLLDCTQERVLQAMKKFGRVEISKHYPSAAEQQRVKSVEDKCNNIVSQKEKELKNADTRINDLASRQQLLQTELTNKKSEIESLKGNIKEKENRLTELQNAEQQIEELKKKKHTLEKEAKEKENEIGLLKNEVNRLKKNGNIQEQLNQIKDPLWKLAEIAGRQSATFPDSDIATNCKNRNNGVYGREEDCEHPGEIAKEKWYKILRTKMNITIIVNIIILLFLFASFYFIFQSGRHEGKETEIATERAIEQSEQQIMQEPDLQKSDSTKQDSIDRL